MVGVGPAVTHRFEDQGTGPPALWPPLAGASTGTTLVDRPAGAAWPARSTDRASRGGAQRSRRYAALGTLSGSAVRVSARHAHGTSTGTGGVSRGARRTQARGAARHRRGLRRHPGAGRLARRWSSGTTSASRPATVRNDMAVLEDEGYIRQPHTSAGRVPTDKGYRLFVDRLSAVKPLSPAERRAIETLPRRRGRPRRRRAPHGAAARPADPAGRRRAVPDR